MRIINLQAENVKRLNCVDITPEGHLVEITGKNGQGKTSVLDAIWWALAGKSNVQAQPVRAGEQKAVIRLTLGEPGQEKRLIVTRTFNVKKVEEGEEPNPSEFTTTVTVENEDGMKAGKAQETLDDLIGALSFDPLLFLKAEPKRQLNILRDLTGVDFTDIDADIKKAFTERTEVNREVASYTAQANAVLVPADAPTERVSVDDLIEELEQAGQTNAEIERQKAGREQRAANARQIRDAASAHDREAEDLENRAAQLRQLAKDKVQEADRITELLAGAEALPDPVDTADLRQQITAARDTNAAVDLVERKAELRKKAAAKEIEADNLTKAINDCKAKKAKIIGDAKMPIPGLGFGENGVLMDDLPFEQASDAQQLEASVAIAAAMNPKLRIIRVRDGSLMDSDALERMATFAEKHDLQVWVETVQSGRANAVVMVDGHVEGTEVQPDLLTGAEKKRPTRQRPA